MKGHSIELPFSSTSKEALFEKLASSEIERWQSPDEFKPHLSLAVIREPLTDEQVQSLRQVVSEIAEQFNQFTIQLSSMGAFPGKRPVFTFLPAANRELLDAHHYMDSRLQETGVETIPYYRKHHWTPHVTLMMGRPRREVSAAMEILSRIWWPGEYILDHIELIEFHPAVKLERIPLK